MKRIIRDKTISFAVTQSMYDLINRKSSQLNMASSSFVYELLKDFLGDELNEQPDSIKE